MRATFITTVLENGAKLEGVRRLPATPPPLTLGEIDRIPDQEMPPGVKHTLTRRSSSASG